MTTLTRTMRQMVLMGVAALACTGTIASAAEPIKTFAWPVPTERSPLAKTPKVALLIGNSYSFYNCGVHGALRGFMQATNPAISMKTRLLTISSGSLSFHDVAHYLAPHELDPYAKLENGKLAHPMFDVVLLQENSAGALSKKRIDAFMRYSAEHAKTIRDAGSTPMLIMTWAKEGKPDDIKVIAENTVAAANAARMRVVPVGLAFDLVRKRAPDIRLTMTEDNHHPNAAGTYLYAAVLYAVLFNRSPEGLDFVGGCEKPLDKAVAEQLERFAWETVQAFEGK